MSKLYRDILYLIFEELQYDKKFLASCLTVNKTWCETVIPILWRNPWKYFLAHEEKKLLLDTIFSHLSDEARNDLSQCFNNFFTNLYNRPLFNYISFCKHLNLEIIEEIIEKLLFTHIHFKEIKNAILNLFINENMEYTHLYIPQHFDYHFIPGSELCFTKIEFLKCYTRVNDNILSTLTKICTSIKELKLFIYEGDNNYHGISKLIENQKSLFRINLNDFSNEKSSYKIIENSLVKHANTMQSFSIVRGQLETKVLTSFVNLKMLELSGNQNDRELKWNNIKDLFLPSLQNLYASNIPINSLVNLIESSGRQLTKIYYYNYYDNVVSNNKIIQTIYQNCSKLMYLELMYKNENILELEKLLINCQCLKRLVLYNDFGSSLFCTIPREYCYIIEWAYLFSILAKSSPPSLFEFIFKTVAKPDLKTLELLFDNWEGRYPISLKFQTFGSYNKGNINELIDLIERYRKKGVVKNLVYYKFDEYTDLLERYKTNRIIKNPKTEKTSIWNRVRDIFH